MDIKERIMSFVEEHYVITLKEAKDMGINAMAISRAVKQGYLHRLARGVYAADEDILFDPLKKYLQITALYPDAVIALISALTFHELTDEEERQIWIALPHSKKIRPPKNVNAMRLSGSAYELGIEAHRIGKRLIKIYDREKSIVDAFKYLTEEVGIKALKAYLKQEKVDIPKLIRYSTELKYPLHDQIKAITTI